MADNEGVTGSPAADAAPEPDAPTVPQPAAAPTPAPVQKTRWRDRAWTFRAMIAVAAASLVIGGVTGGVIGAVANHDEHPRLDRWGPGGPMMGPGWRGNGPRDFNGGPKWRWNDGPQNGPQNWPQYGSQPDVTPTPTPSTPSTPSPSG